MEIQVSGIGKTFYGMPLIILLYTDDDVILSDTENDYQRLIHIVHGWCTKWRLSINKTQILEVGLHKRKKLRSTYLNMGILTHHLYTNHHISISGC